MNVKKMSIGLLLLAAFSTGLIAQGEKDEAPQRNRNRGELQEKAQRNYQGRAGSRDQGLAGEIIALDTSAKTFDVKGKNTVSVHFAVDSDTIIVTQEDFKEFAEKNDWGRSNELRDSIDTEGMSDAEVRQAMFDAREKLIETIQNELSENKIDFSELKEGDEVRVQLALNDSQNNVARLIIVN